MIHFLVMTLWNLLLAVIPVVTAYALSMMARRTSEGGRRRAIAPIVVLGLIWLAFLPNSCYLMTEWRHFLFDHHFRAAREVAHVSRVSSLRVALHAAFFSGYSGFGVVCFAMAVRPVARVVSTWGLRSRWIAAPFFVTVSLGVYLGLMPRLNSWDLAARPTHVVSLAIRAVTTPPVLAVILVYAAVLWILFLFLDIWMDGLALRLGRVNLASASRDSVVSSTARPGRAP